MKLLKYASTNCIPKNMKIKGICKKEFRSLLELATKESLFIFDSSFYSQIDGVAMGSPLGPTLANAFMCNFEETWIQQYCPKQFLPTCFKRYVDDIFALFEDENQVNKFTHYLNSRHTNIKFKVEKEVDFSISFLVILITKGTSFITSLYRKPTFSGVYLNFKSHVPLVYKKGLISCFLYRIFHLCGNWGIIHEEIKKLKDIFIKMDTLRI